MISARTNNVVHLPQLTDAQVAERFAKSWAAQEEFFRRFGLAVVPTRTPVKGLPRWAQMAVDAWAKERFVRPGEN